MPVTTSKAKRPDGSPQYPNVMMDWTGPTAMSVANDIAGITGLDCGPAAVGWIAAVWNITVRGRNYDYMALLTNKQRFPDGPRTFFQNSTQVQVPGVGTYQLDLNRLLLRETDNELRLGRNEFRSYDALWEQMKERHLPFIVLQDPPGAISYGLHYVSLYMMKHNIRENLPDQYKFFWQDNKFTGGTDGLYETGWRTRPGSFKFGVHRVVIA